MSAIQSDSCLLQSYRDSEGNEALARVYTCMCGYAVAVRLVNCGPMGCHWLCRRKDDPQNDYILLLPSARWEQDARDDGFELITKLNQRTP